MIIIKGELLKLSESTYNTKLGEKIRYLAHILDKEHAVLQTVQVNQTIYSGLSSYLNSDVGLEVIPNIYNNKLYWRGVGIC